MAAEWITALARYADRLHATAGDRHHVASPLGAWLLLALAGGENEALGVDAQQAARIAGALLEEPHPLVAAATALWHSEQVDPAALSGWRENLPPATAFGPVPSKGELDAWAKEHTYGLIDRFPLTPSPRMLVLLASALATKVSWQVPFEEAPASRLGGDWRQRLTTVLLSPEHGHQAFIDEGRIVHVADAGGLKVYSVAAAAGVPAREVLAAAYEIAMNPMSRTSLFDLPLGETPLWTIREERAHERRKEHVRALLPAWSATSELNLAEDPGLGFAEATRVIGERLGTPAPQFEAKQVATARYDRYGFEAAAVTGFMTTTSFPPEAPIRHAELRFAHPYAVVAVAAQPGGPWDGVPVFSGWVSDPQ
ncbi:hypothetical protein ACTI_00730 [Actinoplanes sp. OR16]|uniref:hypothetical protein n=1 Tax=Actinoplanes sp. OR16 TaxID=946334 RepID=UPI000F6DFE2A|nr:hypothetical protein [Actinoplanes sp. OR16]BBH63388.1 hypothetical protein ACTI_00730 [Actinoplanes sp. OR16]